MTDLVKIKAQREDTTDTQSQERESRDIYVVRPLRTAQQLNTADKRKNCYSEEKFGGSKAVYTYLGFENADDETVWLREAV